jgi:hypothetical protein
VFPIPLDFIIAQAAAVDVSATFVQYGALGVIAFLALIAVRVLFQREVKALDHERLRADRLEEELRKLNATIQDRYVGTLAEATRVMGDVLDSLKDNRR